MCFKIEWEDFLFISRLKKIVKCDCIKSREKHINVYKITALLLRLLSWTLAAFLQQSWLLCCHAWKSACWPLLGVCVGSHPRIYYLDVPAVWVNIVLSFDCSVLRVWLLFEMYGIYQVHLNLALSKIHITFLCVFISLRIKASVLHSWSIQQCGCNFLCSPMYVVCLKLSLQ